MDFREKKRVILQNRHLPLEELSARTGLRPREIQKILEKNPIEVSPSSAPETSAGIRPWVHWGAALLPAILSILAYLPSLDNQLLNWDDILYIQQNPHIRRLNFSSIQWMFTHFYAGLWIPLTWISLALDYRLGRFDPWFYHLHNLLLHAVNTVLVYFLSVRILRCAGKTGTTGEEPGRNARIVSAAFITALFFGLHPIHVESVAWATERKDLLYGLFFLLGLMVYLDYARDPLLKARKLHVCLGLFVLALFSKAMAVTFPVVLLILDFWPLGRFRTQPAKVFLEKIPLFTAALFSGVMTVLSQSSVGSISDLNLIPLSYRLMNACHSLIFYLVKLAYPSGLAAFYPIDLKKIYSPLYVYSVMACILIALACFIYRRKQPYLAVAGVYYLVSLAPVLGFVQSGSQCAADRFTYLPSLAPSLLLGAAVTALLFRWRSVLLGFAGVLAVLLSLGTLNQTATWKDNFTLWENVLSVNPRNAPCAHANLADGFFKTGRLADALLEYNRAITIGPTASFSHDGKGFTLLQQGRLEEAVQEMQTAIRLEPKNAEFLCHLGMAYARIGKPLDALQKYQESIQADPYWAETYYQTGILDLDQGELGKAREALQKAVALDPDNCFYWMGLNAVLQKMGNN